MPTADMNLWPREDCVSCPQTTPECNCADGEQCTLVSQSCSECAHVVCTAPASSKSTAGPIAGGVIGGLALIGLLVGLYVWWRRKRMRENAPYEPNMSIMDKELGPRDTRAYSIDSVNTTQDRGSNVIPIAYIPGVTAFPERQSHMRGSMATSDYRASLPDFVMAVHGQPSLVEIGVLNRKETGASQYMPHPTEGTHTSSVYDELGLDELTAPFGVDGFEAATNSGKSMVTIPEDPEEEIPFGALRSVSGASRRTGMHTGGVGPITAAPIGIDPRDRSFPRRHSSIRSRGGGDRNSSARYSRNSSVREYNMNIPEEAFLYYNTPGHAEE